MIILKRLLNSDIVLPKDTLIGYNWFWCRDYNVADKAVYAYVIQFGIKRLFYIRKFISIKKIKEV